MTDGRLSGPVLVLLDHAADGTLRPAVLELLTVARTLGETHGVWLGDGTPDAATAGTFGVRTVHRAVLDRADPRSTPVAAEAVAALVGELSAAALLLVSSFENKEIAARLGVATGAGVVVDASEVAVVDGRVVAAKTVLAGTWNTRCAVRTPLAVVALKAGSVQAAPAPDAAPATVVDHDVAVSPVASRQAVVEHVERPRSGRPSLTEAQVVVAGGRGTEGDFSVVEELADTLGAAVGATRVATDEGWIGHDAQIGQTGVTVSPRLYIGAGVSGAVHHRGGKRSAGTIVALNSDPDTPIFEIADLGIVGDLFTVLPQATAELRTRKG